MLVPLPQPYDFELSTARFDVYGRDAATLWRDGGLHRVFAGREVRLEAAPGGVDVHPHDGAIEAEVLRFLGLPFELEPFRAWAEADPVLGPLARGLPGYRPVLQPDPFEALVTSITAQQVSLQSAAAIRTRFVERYGKPFEYAHAFPERERIAEATEGELFGLGFSNRKAEYVIALARSDLDLDELSELPDEEVRARLVALRGLGDWTADWFLARHLGRPHAWPAGDLGLRKAVAAFYGDVPDLRAFAQRLHPYENLSAHYLLNGLPSPSARMSVRHATAEDFDALHALWDQWQGETTPPPWADVSWEANRPEFEHSLDANALFVAEEDGRPVGFVTAWLEGHSAKIGDLYVAEAGRRHGTGRLLVETVIENLRARGATHLFLNANPEAHGFYERLGFREESRNLVLPLDVREVGAGPSFGSIHVQTDDLTAVERAVQQFVPRLSGGSRGSEVTRPRNGWITVYDEACDRDPAALRRLAKELSERTAAVVIAIGVEHEQVVRFILFEAGRIVDEYLSVPEHYGALPPGDVIALAANPRVVARLTGAQPAAVRAVARTGASPAELPPPQELLESIAAAIGLEGAERGWQES